MKLMSPAGRSDEVAGAEARGLVVGPAAGVMRSGIAPEPVAPEDSRDLLLCCCDAAAVNRLKQSKPVAHSTTAFILQRR